tara:strand:+ start:107 stop:364 length:258 start_codon:yes stop_codon:yes gene_type:complete
MNEVHDGIMTEGHRDYDNVVAALRAAAIKYRDLLDPTGSNRLECYSVYDGEFGPMTGVAVGYRRADGHLVAYVVFPMPAAEPPIV